MTLVALFFWTYSLNNLVQATPECRLPNAPTVLYDQGPELHQVWNLDTDLNSLGNGIPNTRSLQEFRSAIHERLPNLEPISYLLHQAEVFQQSPDPGYRAEAHIPLKVANGLGKIVPIQCWEALLLAQQTDRLPMAEHPTEFGASILTLGHQTRIYYSTQNRMGLSSTPAQQQVDARIEQDLQQGWSLKGHLHNHPFDLKHPVHPMGGPSPSLSDVQVYKDRTNRWRMEKAWVTNGFYTAELTAAEIASL